MITKRLQREKFLIHSVCDYLINVYECYKYTKKTLLDKR